MDCRLKTHGFRATTSRNASTLVNDGSGETHQPNRNADLVSWRRRIEDGFLGFWVFGFLFESEVDDVVVNVWVFVVLMKKMELKMDVEEDD